MCTPIEAEFLTPPIEVNRVVSGKAVQVAIAVHVECRVWVLSAQRLSKFVLGEPEGSSGMDGQVKATCRRRRSCQFSH